MAIVSSKLLISFYSLPFLIVINISQAKAQPIFTYNSWSCINDNGNYTTNSTYHNNLNTLLSNFTSNTEINYGFYNSSYGENNDKVNVIGLCRGDVKPDVCRSCLNDSRILLPKLCPNQKEAIGWYNDCMFRYSNRSIFGVMETSPPFYLLNINNVTDQVNEFKRVLGNLMKKLKEKAASGDFRRKYAADNETNDNLNFQTIYGLVQCTPDLSSQQCNACLDGAISRIPFCCNNKIGGRVLLPSCNIRYESALFYGPTPVDETNDPTPVNETKDPTPVGKTSPPKDKGKSLHTTIAIIVPIVIVAAAALLIFICICLRRSKAKKNLVENEDDNDEIEIAQSLQFNFDTIRVATSNFSDANKLGQGGFGVVYQGKLSSGQLIAVKRLSRDSGQGDIEFKNEVCLVAKLQHRNLVRLLGFCLEGRERLLIYEFVLNKSLDYFIFDSIKKAQLDWEKRYKIIGGIVRGLLYLHEDSQLRIIHRDLKASNILLDEDMNPKISDFGMARLLLVDQSQVNTNKVVGTYGYMAPEYVLFGQCSVKSDVFSLGVLVLEIISGKKIGGILHGESVEDLLSLAWRSWREGTLTNIIDPSLNNISQNEIMRCIHIGLLCVQEKLVDRPTMATIGLMLSSYSLTLPLPLEPASFMGGRTTSLTYVQSGEDNSGQKKSNESKSKSAKQLVNENSIAELYPQ